jgi:hypothetical protein
MGESAFGLDLPHDLVVHDLLTAAGLREGLSEPLPVDTSPPREIPGPGPETVRATSTIEPPTRDPGP